jgi:DNA mismatch repair protein MLH1
MPPIVKLKQEIIDRIAAGEVVQRPSAALKEMIENALDAGATQINIACQDGGLTQLQIRDDGSGIAVTDLPLLCERFATSKLREFEDLASIATFGFRGEALASISHVAHVTVVTRTRDSDTAWQATYSAGAMLSCVPFAGVQGTTITVQDLFYNNQLRKRAFSRTGDEYTKICDVVTRYALANPGVGFTCQKTGAPRLDVSVPKGLLDAKAVVANRFGEAVARHLVTVEAHNEARKFSLKGCITDLSYTGKRGYVTLFVNGRLVTNSAIQRAVDHVYAPFLATGARSFVMLSITVDPSTVDVNIHPTKHEVLLLNEDTIVKAVFDVIKPTLMTLANGRTVAATNAGSRTLPTVAVPSSGEGTEGNASQLSRPLFAEPTAAAMLAPIRARGDAQRGAIERFLVPMGASLPHHQPVNEGSVQPRREQPRPPEAPPTVVNVDEDDEEPPAVFTASDFVSQLRRGIAAAPVDDDDADEDEAAERQKLVSRFVAAAAPAEEHGKRAIDVEASPFHVTSFAGTSVLVSVAEVKPIEVVQPPDEAIVEDLESVATILSSFDGASNDVLRELSRGLKFVGCIDSQRFLAQSRTTLYLVDTQRFAYEAALQIVFRRWSRLPRYQLLQPQENGEHTTGIPVAPLIDFALRNDEGLRCQVPTEDLRARVVDAAIEVLDRWAAMLKEYFGISLQRRIDGSLMLLEVPAPLGVTWPLRQRAVPLLLIRIATAVDFSSETTALGGVGREIALLTAASEVDSNLPLREAVAESVRRNVQLPAAMASEQSVVAIVTVEALYKVFERC